MKKMRYLPYQLVQDFFHQQYGWRSTPKKMELRPVSKNRRFPIWSMRRGKSNLNEPVKCFERACKCSVDGATPLKKIMSQHLM